MTDRKLALLPTLLALLAFAAVPFAADAATVTVVNLDGPNEGFNDPTPATPVGGNPGTTLGEQRQIVFQTAADTWGATIASDVEIFVESNFNPLPCDATSAVLGQAGTLVVSRDFTNAPFPGTWYHIALANALAGVDQDPGGNDIGAEFNSAIDNNENCLAGTNWYLGLDNNEGGDIDLLAVVLHEFAHGLGFANFVDETTGALFLGFPDVYTHFTFDFTANLHWDEMSNSQRVASAINTGNVVWDGANVTNEAPNEISSGTNMGFVRLYAPDPVRPGSSISHYDTVVTPNVLMEPFITPDIGDDLDLTDELLVDEGWTREVGCGNGTCEAGEDCFNCPADCEIQISGAECGNGICEAGNGEDCVSCPADCNGKQSGKPANRFCCGDGDGQNPLPCSDPLCSTGGFSCTNVPVNPGTECCGDSICMPGEDCNNCALDCTLGAEQCTGGVDEDCDGNVDCDDPDCLGPPPDPACDCIPTHDKEKGPRCSNGIDDDCDGLIDGADPDC